MGNTENAAHNHSLPTSVYKYLRVLSGLNAQAKKACKKPRFFVELCLEGKRGKTILP